ARRAPRAARPVGQDGRRFRAGAPATPERPAVVRGPQPPRLAGRFADFAGRVLTGVLPRARGRARTTAGTQARAQAPHGTGARVARGARRSRPADAADGVDGHPDRLPAVHRAAVAT